MNNIKGKYKKSTTWSGYTGRWKSQNSRGGYENCICIKNKSISKTSPESKKR